MTRLMSDLPLNGTHDSQPRTTRRKSASRTPSTRPASRRGLRHARRLALLVGGIGTAVLGLSVVHCTESIALLTGSHWLLAGLLAVGIDAGMVASELAEVASHGTKAEARVKPWARGPRIAAALLVGTFGMLACLLVAAGLWPLAIPPAGAALIWAADMFRD